MFAKGNLDVAPSPNRAGLGVYKRCAGKVMKCSFRMLVVGSIWTRLGQFETSTVRVRKKVFILLIIRFSDIFWMNLAFNQSRKCRNSIFKEVKSVFNMYHLFST